MGRRSIAKPSSWCISALFGTDIGPSEKTIRVQFRAETHGTKTYHSQRYTVQTNGQGLCPSATATACATTASATAAAATASVVPRADSELVAIAAPGTEHCAMVSVAATRMQQSSCSDGGPPWPSTWCRGSQAPRECTWTFEWDVC